MFGGYTPQYAAALAAVLAACLLFSGSDGRLDFTGPKSNRPSILTSGRQISMIASIILCASLIIGVLGITGLGVKIFTDFVCLWRQPLPDFGVYSDCLSFLGMEVPTTAAYVICVSVAGPALIDRGLDPLLFICSFSGTRYCRLLRPRLRGVFIAAGMIEKIG